MSSNSENPIELKSFPGKLDNCRFVSLYCPSSPADEDVFCLTPHVMQWSENIYLFDLHSCRHYWRSQQQALGVSLLELYETVLPTVFGDNMIAVFCDHPWQGLLFLYYLVDSEARGVYALNSLFSKKAYAKLPWQHWFSALSVLAEHLDSIRARQFNVSRFRAKTAQLQRFIQRMDLFGPYALRQAEVAAIKRRYSGWLGEAWSWTFLRATDDQQSTTHNCSLAGFPWRALKFRQSIMIKRHLDYALSEWHVVEPLLREDLGKLCRLDGWSAQDKITSLHWCITLFNLQQVDIDIQFRHPYALHKDAPGFNTALYQAYYAYLDMMQAVMQRDTDLDLPEAMPFISWQLEVQQRLHMPPLLLDMFEADKSAACYDSILDLQNCLPRQIEHYVIEPDFVPEQLFSMQAVGYTGDHDFSLQQWSAIALSRPLFYYPQAMQIKDSQGDYSAGRQARFLERTADNWWQSNNTKDVIRDYFLLKNQQGEYLWVYRNSAGEWYQHGIYS